jgi:thioredoxin reductase (NADPH)
MARNSNHEVMIIGGGVAGMTAAMWCAELGMNALLIDENEDLGGQLLWIYNRIENYPGIFANNGRELRDLLTKSLTRLPFERRLNTRATKVDLSSKHIVLNSGEMLSGKAIILATGVRRRKLGVEGEDEFAGRGVMASGAGERETVRDKRVVIVGGGDAAFENALILSELASELTLVHRKDRFSARDEFVNAVRERKYIQLEREAVVQKIVGNDMVEGVQLLRLETGKSHYFETDNVLVRIGVEPNSELLSGQVAVDENHYAVVDVACRTSIPGVFIAGDIANPVSPTIATAVGMGAAAAKAAHQFLAPDSKK